MPIEQRIVAVDEFHRLHDTGIVDQHVEAAESGLRPVEQIPHRFGIADVGLDGRRPATGVLDLLDQRVRGFCICGIIDDDGKAVAGQPFRHRGANAARGAGHDRDPIRLVRHSPSLSGEARFMH
jgi:hypothetical protein